MKEYEVVHVHVHVQVQHESARVLFQLYTQVGREKGGSVLLKQLLISERKKTWVYNLRGFSLFNLLDVDASKRALK